MVNARSVLGSACGAPGSELSAVLCRAKTHTGEVFCEIVESPILISKFNPTKLRFSKLLCAISLLFSLGIHHFAWQLPIPSHILHRRKMYGTKMNYLRMKT